MLFFLPPAHAARSLLQQLGPCKPGCTPAHISASDPPPGWILPVYRLKSGTSSGISLATSGAQHVSVRATAEQWNYAISSCKKKSWSRLGWDETLGFPSFFIFFFSLLCGMKAWLLEQLCNHKGKAHGCWLGGVLAQLHPCSWFCESFQASLTQTLPIFPAPEPATSKTSLVFFTRNWCLQWNECPQLSFDGENTHFLLKASVARHRQGSRCCSCVFIAVILFWSAHLLKSTFSTEQDLHW